MPNKWTTTSDWLEVSPEGNTVKGTFECKCSPCFLLESPSYNANEAVSNHLCTLTNHPIPAGLDHYYFEVEVLALDSSKDGAITS